MKTYKEYLAEMAYPKSFDMEYFKSLSSFAAKLRYADTYLQKMASGSARTIFQIDDEKVLKLAKNKKGIAQNRVECDFYLQGFDCLAKVYDFDKEDNTFLEMELAKKITKSRFKQLLGFSLDDINDYLYNMAIQYNLKGIYRQTARMRDIKNIEALEESNFIDELRDVILSYGMVVPGDFDRISTYGEVLRDGEPTVVVIDFGLTNGVYDDFYKRV